MNNERCRFVGRTVGGWLLLAAASAWPQLVAAQGLTGTLIGTVKDAQGGVLPAATVRVSSPVLIGGLQTLTTNERGQLRFPALPPGGYTLDIELPGFDPFHEGDIRIGAGATIERNAVLNLAGIAESVVVQGPGSRIDARSPGFGTRFGAEDIGTIPTRRASMFDMIRAAPGISATSPSSGTTTTVSAFGSGTNENQFLIDGTNFTCPCNGVARAEPGVDFIQEVQVQAVGASAEFGNVQGAVINVVTRQGSDRYRFDGAYYAQPPGLTSQPVVLPMQGSNRQTGYERSRYRDATTNLGGPAVRDHLWFFLGYQYLRDYDSQPGTDPDQPRTYEQNKFFVKLTWRLAPGWQLDQSFHDEHWVSPEQPTIARPYETTLRSSATVPAITFGHLTHTVSANTVWDVRVGRFRYEQLSPPSTGIYTTSSHTDQSTGFVSGAPPQFGGPTIMRTTAKATLNHYRSATLGADHDLKVGGQFERGQHHALMVIPTGVRYVDNAGVAVQSIASEPSNTGGRFDTASFFASDGLTIGDRLTVNAGVRFDHNRAISQDLHAVDLSGQETDTIIHGLGTLYTWNVWSPRLGAAARLTADGRTMLRASYGRFYQGVLTGEIGQFHPGATPVTTTDFATGASRTVDPKVNLLLDGETRAPYTDEYSIGVDRELAGRIAVAAAYVRKTGDDYIGWSDIGGQYPNETRPLPDGRVVPVFALVNAPSARRFYLTNQDDYSMRYNGLVVAVERRRSDFWQAFGSYTFSRTEGLMASSGATPAGAQVSTVAPPPGTGVTFGRDPNDLTNASGRLPNDRPHMFRAMTSVDLGGTGVVIAANYGYFTGKPWAATALVSVPQNAQQRVQIETRGSRRLSSQSLLDLRLSKRFAVGRSSNVELLLDVLNLLNETAEESLATDNQFGATFAQPTAFVDPRRAMIGVKVNLGR